MKKELFRSYGALLAYLSENGADIDPQASFASLTVNVKNSKTGEMVALGSVAYPKAIYEQLNKFFGANISVSESTKVGSVLSVVFEEKTPQKTVQKVSEPKEEPVQEKHEEVVEEKVETKPKTTRGRSKTK